MLEKQETTVIPNEPIVREIESYEQKAAGFWMRFWAFIIDLLVISAVIGIVINPIFYLMDWSFDDSIWYAPISIISAIVYYAYFVLLTKWWSQTIGKMIFGLRVKKDNGEKLDWMTVIFRECIGRFISNTFLKVPYLLVIFTPQHKAIHDFAADTVVVHEDVFSQKKVFKQEVMDLDTVSTTSM
ncbi:RDD family protein [Lysinibacillus sp. KU-BSD001]|uniref:RDD family protein n=1 Tax=Lysinibacillus sp. KU-BSD001 TaxID=3141328 RepID=UPI0036E588D8